MPKSNSRKLRSFIVVALLILAIPLAVFLTQKPQKYSSKAEGEQVDGLTRDIVTIQDDKNATGVKKFIRQTFGQSDVQLEKNQVASAQIRHDKLVSLAENDPEEFIKHADLYTERNKFPDEVKDLIEKPVDVQGKLKVAHYDDFQNKKSEYKFFIEVGDKKFNVLTNSAPNVSGLIPEAQVSIQSVGIGDDIVVAQSQGSEVDVLSIPPTTQQKSVKAAVILYRFRNTISANGFTKQDVENELLSNDDSTRNYFRQNSYGKLLFSATIFDWITLDLDENPDGGCDEDNWTKLAKTQLESQGVDFSTYTNFLYVSSVDHNNCGFAHAYIDAPDTYYSNDNSAWTYSHELGHNLGLEHANSLTCGDKVIDDQGVCQNTEYGDIYDNMGFGYGTFLNAPHTEALGWFNPGQIQEVTETGTYTIHPIENGSKTPLALKITKPDTGEAYYLEYRQPIGFDAKLRDYTAPFDGASLRLVQNPAAHTFLLDVTPMESQFEDSGFRQEWGFVDGKTFNDTKSGIVITQVSHDANSVVLEIAMPGEAPKNTSIKAWKKTELSISGDSGYASDVFKYYRNKLYIFHRTGNNNRDNNNPLEGEISFANVTNSEIGSFSNAGSIPQNLDSIDSLFFSGDNAFLIARELHNYSSALIYTATINSDGTFGQWRLVNVNLPGDGYGYGDQVFEVNNKLYYFTEEYNATTYHVEHFLYIADMLQNGDISTFNKTATEYPSSENTVSSFIPNGNRLYAFVNAYGKRGKAYVGDVSDSGVSAWQEIESPPAFSSFAERILIAGNKVFQFDGYESVSVNTADIKSDGSFSAWSYTNPIDVEMGFMVTTDGTSIYLAGSHITRPFSKQEFYIGEIGTELNPIQIPEPTPSPRPSPTVSPSPTPSPSPSPTPTPLPGLITSCARPHDYYSFDHVDLTINVDVLNGGVGGGGGGYWYTLTDNSENITAVISYAGPSILSAYHDTVYGIRRDVNGNWNDIFLKGDGRTYTLRVYRGDYTDGMPILTNSVYSLTTTPLYCPVSSPTVSPYPTIMPTFSPSPTASPSASVSPTPEATSSAMPSPVPSPAESPNPTTIPEASSSPVPTSSPTTRVGDVNNDGAVNILDFGLIVEHYEESGTNIIGDVNHDGTVNILDFGLVVEFYDR